MLRSEMAEQGRVVAVGDGRAGCVVAVGDGRSVVGVALGDGRAGASLRSEMAEQGASLRSDIAVLSERFEVTDARIDASKFEVLATLRQEMVQQTRTFVLANVAGIFTAVGLAFAAAKLA